jgi:hypothetical protein
VTNEFLLACSGNEKKQEELNSELKSIVQEISSLSTHNFTAAKDSKLKQDRLGTRVLALSANLLELQK